MRPASPASSASMRALCSGSSEKENTSKLAAMRSRLRVLGKTTCPRSSAQRSATCVGPTPMLAPISTSVGSVTVRPRARGDQPFDNDGHGGFDGASAREGGPGLEHHAEPLGVGAQVGVGEEGVGFNLQDVRDDRRDRPHCLDVLAFVVRQADRACGACVERVLEGGPGQGDVTPVEGGQRPVHEEEVDVVGAQVLEGALDGCGGPLGLVVGVVDLRRDEQVLARDSRGLERRPDLGLVAVHLSGVDVTVPDLEGAAHRVVRVLGRDLVGAETENGDGRFRREHQGWNRGRGRGVLGGKRGVHR